MQNALAQARIRGTQSALSADRKAIRRQDHGQLGVSLFEMVNLIKPLGGGPFEIGSAALPGMPVEIAVDGGPYRLHSSRFCKTLS